MRDSVLRLSCVLALAAPGLARAQGAPQPPTPSDAADGAAAPEERTLSPAEAAAVVESVRKELLALIDADAPRSTRSEADAPAPALRSGALPESVTAAAAPTTPERAAGAPRVERKDLAWLEGLKLPDLPVRWDDRLVRTLEYYKDDPRGRALMRTLQARRGRYQDMMRAKLRAAGLPQDLVYLAMAESAFEPTARSEVGALGLWQFMSAPAAEYGLESSRWVDQRMNPERATDAAVSFLRHLNQNLGSWPLAMAAYNMGYGALLRSIQKYNSNDFWLLSNLEAGLPYETIVYVNKIIACAIVGANLERFGLGDLKLDAPESVAWVEVPGGVSLARVARTLGMDPEALAALNTELKKSRVPPDVKTWTLRVPSDRAARFKEKWAKGQPEPPSHRTHVLRMGERLADLAEAYGTTAGKLLALNGLKDARTLQAGTKILLPDVEAAPSAAPAQAPHVGVPGDVFVYVDRRRVFYRVTEEDSLEEIGAFFGVNADELRMWNRIAPDARLQRGMYLQLFVPSERDLSQALVLTPDEVRTLVVGSEEFFDFHETQQNRVRLRYRVKAGDTLHSLAERFDLSVGSIARINQFSRDKKLDPDSEIIVYVPEDTAKRAAAN
jgi:membrane-bound lytic murein transglycosylase D